MQHGKLTLLLTSLLILPGCGLWKTRIEYVPKEVVVTKYRAIPEALLHHHCATLKLSDLVTRADVEAALAKAWVCVQDHNRDKDEIEGLQ